jgi:hypothetical protein
MSHLLLKICFGIGLGRVVLHDALQIERQKTKRPSERRVNGRTENTMAIRKKGKWKDRQHNGHQKEG